jgi:outer membrane protein TolC
MLVLLCIVNQCVLAAQEADPKPITHLTMAEAVRLAHEHRPDLASLAQAIQANRSGAKAAIAGYYPTITFIEQLTQSNGQGDPVNLSSINANQMIYSFAGPQQLYRRAKSYAELSEVERAVQENVVRWEVERAFLQAYLIQENDRLIQSTFEAAKVNYKKSKNENKQDLLDKNEWLKRVESYAASIAFHYQFDDDVQIAFRKLELLLGQPVFLVSGEIGAGADKRKTTIAKMEWQHPSKAYLAPLNTYMTYAIDHRPEIRLGIKKMDIEQANIKLAQGARLPTFTANFQAGFQGEFGLTAPIGPLSQIYDKEFHNVTIGATWTLFDGVVNQHQERQARANKLKELLAQQQTILTIKSDVQEKYFTYAKALLQIKAQKMSYLRSRNEFKLRKQELAIGQISPVDFKTAESNWEQAEYDWITRNVDLALKHHDLMFSCGYPAEMEG